MPVLYDSSTSTTQINLWEHNTMSQSNLRCDDTSEINFLFVSDQIFFIPFLVFN